MPLAGFELFRCFCFGLLGPGGVAALAAGIVGAALLQWSGLAALGSAKVSMPASSWQHRATSFFWRTVQLVLCPDAAPEEILRLCRRRKKVNQGVTVTVTEAKSWRQRTRDLCETVGKASPWRPQPPEASDPFDIALQWLRRSALSIGFSDQLRLHSLYLQAISGDAEASVSLQAPLARAKYLGWQALRGLPSWTARCRLPFALAEVDSGFRAAHPHLARPTRSEPASLASLVLQTLECRVPIERWDSWVTAAQRCLFWFSGAATCFLLFTKARRGSRPATPAVLTCGAMTLYTAALVHGAPAWLHADMRLRLGLVKFKEETQQDVLHRIRRKAARFFSPRVTHSLFCE